VTGRTAPALRAAALHILHQIPDFDLQRIGDGFQSPERHVHFAAFDRADLRPVNAADIGEDILTPLPLQTQFTNSGSDGPLNILHCLQFKSRLFIRIPFVYSLCTIRERRRGSEPEALEMRFDEMVELELQVIVEQIRGLNRSIEKLEQTIKDRGQKLKGHRNLTSIKGIGNLGASILLSVIGDIDDFADEGKLAAYFGIVPRVQNSNATERSGRITKRGTKLGRTTLVQCALVAKRYSPHLARYYDKIKTRRGGGKAIIALARKFLGIIYRTLKNGWVFEDFPNFVLAEAA